MDVKVEHLDQRSWRTLRDMRLAALADSPHAFWATLADEGRNDRDQWICFVRAVAWFVAHRDTGPAALAGVLCRDETPEEGEVIGMWVRPAERGRGTAGLLMQHIDGFARNNGMTSLSLWVTDGNTAAHRLYERHGFTGTGERDGLPRLRGRTGGEERMRRVLS